MRTDYVTMKLLNPSPNKRRGHVITSWPRIAREAGVSDDTLAARVEWKNESGEWESLRAQVDRLDTADTARDQLVFALSGLIDPGDENYGTTSGEIRVYPGERDETEGPTAEEHYTGVKLKNDRLEVWINTAATKLGVEPSVFGGATTSVLLWRFEMLDALNRYTQHYPYKRCMQIDRVHLVRPPWDVEGSVDVFPGTDYWEPVYLSQGPVRAVATIASKPFLYECAGSGDTKEIFDCRLYRAISLFQYADWVGEEVWLRGQARSGGDPVSFWFMPRYFMLAELSLYPDIFRYPDHPGWFAITSNVDPKHGYAFATDAQAGPIWNPPLDYPDRNTEHRAFSWEVGPTRCAHNFHIFRLGTNPKDLADAAGYRWYDLAFKPIRARLVEDE